MHFSVQAINLKFGTLQFLESLIMKRSKYPVSYQNALFRIFNVIIFLEKN